MSINGHIAADRSHLSISREELLPSPEAYLQQLDDQETQLLGLGLNDAAQKVRDHIDELSSRFALSVDEVDTIANVLKTTEIDHLGVTVDRHGVHFTPGESGRTRHVARAISYLVEAIPEIVYNGVIEMEADKLCDYRRIVVKDNRVTEQVPSHIVWKNL